MISTSHNVVLGIVEALFSALKKVSKEEEIASAETVFDFLIGKVFPVGVTVIKKNHVEAPIQVAVKILAAKVAMSFPETRTLDSLLLSSEGDKYIRPPFVPLPPSSFSLVFLSYPSFPGSFFSPSLSHHVLCLI